MAAKTDDKRDQADARAAFKKAANMAPAVLEKWLDSDDSKKVGWKGTDGDGEGESVGHKSGRRIIAIKRTRAADLDASDYAHMRKVVAYVERHSAQRPKGDLRDTRWRYSLMNWGHDPLKA